MKSCLNHRKNASKVMVVMNKSYQDNPIAIIFIMVAWPEEAYEIDFYKKCSKRDFPKNVPVLDRSFLKSSGGLPEPIWGKISRSRRWNTSRTPKSNPKTEKIKKQIRYKTSDLPPQRLICYLNRQWSM